MTATRLRARNSLAASLIFCICGLLPEEGFRAATSGYARTSTPYPGALVYLVRQGTTADELDRLLEHELGLSSLGGLDGTLGFAVFTYRVAQAVAAMTTALGGLDALVFTAGIGEHRHDVREAVAERVRFLGIELDRARNADVVPDFDVGARGSAVRVWVVRAREELIAARAARALLGS